MGWQALLESALRCGIGTIEFWQLTPRETHAAIKAAEWRVERQQRQDAWLAWHTAALSRARRLPPLRRLISPGKSRELKGEELERRRRERDEMLRQIDVQKINEAVKKRGR